MTAVVMENSPLPRYRCDSGGRRRPVPMRNCRLLLRQVRRQSSSTTVVLLMMILKMVLPDVLNNSSNRIPTVSTTVTAFTVPSIVVTSARTSFVSSLLSLSASPYEEYMDARQKQQQQYQSFRQMNTATTYETTTTKENLVATTAAAAVVVETAVQPSNNNDNTINDPILTVPPPPPDLSETATTTTTFSSNNNIPSAAAAGVWSNGWNGNSVLNVEQQQQQQQQQPVVMATPRSNYMYQKNNNKEKKEERLDPAVSVQPTTTFGSIPQQQPSVDPSTPTITTTATATTLLPKSNYMYRKPEMATGVTDSSSSVTMTTVTTATPRTFGVTIPSQQQQPPTVSFASAVHAAESTTTITTTTTTPTQPSSTSGSTSSSVETTKLSTIDNPNAIGKDEGRPIFPTFSSTTVEIPSTTTASTTTTTLAPTDPKPTPSLVSSVSESTSSLLETTQSSSSSLWDEYNANRQKTEGNQITSVQPQQHDARSVPSSTRSIANEGNVVTDKIVLVPSNGWNIDYDENNDPEPKQFDFMGNTQRSTMMNTASETIATTAELSSNINDMASSGSSNTALSDESFLRAITSVETISPTSTAASQPTTKTTISIEDTSTESEQKDASFTNNPFQTFWESNMAKLTNAIGSSNGDNGNKPVRPELEIPPPKPYIDTRGMTERIMKKIDTAKMVEKQQQSTTSVVGGAGGSTTYEAFLKVEENWTKLKQQSSKPIVNGSKNRKSRSMVVPFVTSDAALGNPNCWIKLRQQANLAASTGAPSIQLDYDIAICGGTLGIFFALALLLRNPKLRVCVVESAPAIRGRDQEWNISLSELYELIKLGVLTESDLNDIITTEFPACRSGFKNLEVSPLNGGYFENNVGYECATDGVLNLGVSPALLLERVAERFRKLGGVIRADTRLFGVTVSDTVGTALDIGDTNEPITTHLLIDCMGNASPISRQQRDGIKPDGVCAVVGSCAAGFDPATNVQGDIIYTMDPIQDKGENGKLQYFWEAFPVGIGRNGIAPGTSNVKTTYMFTYMDADEKRPSLETLMEDYWKMLPTYQPSITNPETDLDVKRVLFAYFPTYTDSPVKPQFSRILPVGDASGIQSPLSFGGFGALTRHLDRIVTSVDEALSQDLLQKEYLGEINAYAPNLSAAWMFQKAMSIKMGQNVDETFVNRLLAVNFEVMNNMGQRTIKPFLQDVIRFDGLVGSLARGFVADPTFMPQIVAHVGIPRLVDWLGHVSMMGLYSVLDSFASPIIKPLVNNMNDPAEQFLWRRRMEAWKFGCGNDYELPEEN